MKNQLVILLTVLLFPLAGFSQNEFPRDTSYAVWSDWQKIKKDYPEVIPVAEFKSDQFLTLPNQVYRVRDNRILRMDVFIPNCDPGKKRPLVMMIHGGGWRSGDKSHLVPLAQKLAMEGYVTASVEQRLSMEALYPAAPQDLKEAIRYLKHNCDVYGIDTTRIAVLGASSGATMASLMATTGTIDKFDDPESVYPHHTAEVQALINVDGVVDFTDPNESAKDTNPDKPSAGALFFGCTYKECPEKWVEASPIQYAGKDTPPTLYVNSAQPRFHAGRDELFKVLDQYGIYHEQHTIDNSPHTFWLFHPWFEDTHSFILNFLNHVFQ
ncbi:alpha/beta hydrolase [Mangrovibacterium diazotrophicum]|uniref:Acetyl esterase/lipase n=1 Tax=Mangrovibacterium diazotrophicum TaxID=1261403 RepID=A0A419W6K1_9BACT|nr:alpha/beta hydrolase [Mangrovibacterium diazotrophicum]RKD91093.1 acetyl esterase/lipase [Mangrovibacterium diazotrophicum]